MISKLRHLFFKLRAIKWAKNEYTFILNKVYNKEYKLATNFKSILHINTSDSGGGAAKIASELCQTQIKNGFNSNMLVANKKSTDKYVEEIKVVNSKKQHFLKYGQDSLQWQDFFHQSTAEIINLSIFKEADIIHLHNLHGNYFSPLALPLFSQNKPIVWSLHDMHSFTGHCAHSFECAKWEKGCGNCPQLNSYPSITKDTTGFIWNTKQKIYDKSNLHIVVLSDWLRKKVENSILSNQKIYTIHNGIDTSIYCKVDKVVAREKTGIPLDKKVVLFSADMGVNNPYKGGEFVKKIIDKYSNDSILFINIGGGKEVIKNSSNWKIPYVNDPTEMAFYYSAADIYLYPTLADNCPLVVLEAMSCGLPILTFNTGGVPELVQHEETGYVADYKSFEDLCKGFELLVDNEELRNKMGENGCKRVQENFTVEIMNAKYMKIYTDILN